MKKYITISQIICSMFLLLFIIGLFLPTGYVLRVFGIINSSHIIMMFLVLEFIFIISYFILKKEYKNILWNLLFLPIFFIFFIYSYLDTSNISYRVKIDNFDKEILIENKSILLNGSSKIYQIENIFVVKYVYDVGGDDGYCPLENRDWYDIINYENGVEIIYSFNGGDDPIHLYLKFNNGNLERVISLD